MIDWDNVIRMWLDEWGLGWKGFENIILLDPTKQSLGVWVLYRGSLPIPLTLNK